MSLNNNGLVLEKSSHIYRLEGSILPGISGIIKAAGLVDTKWFTEYSREKGSAVHLACQLYDENDLDEATLDPVIIPYLEGWKQFRSDTGFIPSIIERPLHSTIYRFAGTPDRAGIMNGVDVIPEIKTGGISFVTGLQLAAQDILLSEAEGFRAKKRFAVQIKSNGTYKLTQYADPQDRVYFLSALSMYNLKAKNNLLKEE
jgi:hypothetical protein